MNLNCRGQRCPQPVIELARAAKTAQPGERIEIVTDDPAALVDIPAWSRMRRHQCEQIAREGDVVTHLVTIQGN